MAFLAPTSRLNKELWLHQLICIAPDRNNELAKCAHEGDPNLGSQIRFYTTVRDEVEFDQRRIFCKEVQISTDQTLQDLHKVVLATYPQYILFCKDDEFLPKKLKKRNKLKKTNKTLVQLKVT